MTLPRELLALVIDVVAAILGAPDREAAARRAHEAARHNARDAAAKRAKPRPR